MRCKVVSVLIMAVLMSACATVRHNEKVEYEKSEVKYPPISLVVNGGSATTGKEIDFQYALFKALAESQMFLGISNDEKYSPFTLEIEINDKNEERGGENTAKAWLGVFSLMLIPITLEHQFNMNAVLKYKGVVVELYSYTVHRKQLISLFKKKEMTRYIGAEVLISHLLRDLAKDKVFSVKKIDNSKG